MPLRATDFESVASANSAKGPLFLSRGNFTATVFISPLDSKGIFPGGRLPKAVQDLAADDAHAGNTGGTAGVDGGFRFSKEMKSFLLPICHPSAAILFVCWRNQFSLLRD